MVKRRNQLSTKHYFESYKLSSMDPTNILGVLRIYQLKWNRNQLTYSELQSKCESVQLSIFYLYMYCLLELQLSKWRVGIPFTGLTRTHFYACPTMVKRRNQLSTKHYFESYKLSSMDPTNILGVLRIYQLKWPPGYKTISTSTN
jgi:hypothetical protein